MAATLVQGYTFGATETVTNAKLHTLVTGATISGISNGEIAAGASIDESKINFSGTSVVTIANAGYKNIESYSSFSNAISSIGATETTLLIGSTQTVSTDETVPSTLTLWFTKGGDLNIDSGKTVTINGTIDAKLYQIFKGSGTVQLGSGVVNDVFPEWWGAVGDGDPPNVTGTDDATAFTNMISSFTGDGTPIIKLSKWYKVATTIAIPDNASATPITFHMVGVSRGGHQHWGGCGLVGTMGDSTSVLATADNTDEARVVVLEDFGIVGNAGSGVGIFLRQCTRGTLLRNVAVVRCGSHGIEMEDSWNSSLEYCFVRENDGIGITTDTISDTQFLGCRVVDNDGGNLSIHYDISSTTGAISVIGGDYSQYATTGVDQFCIRAGWVIGLTIQGIFIENNEVGTQNNHLINITGQAAGNRCNGLVIQGCTISSSATGGTAYPIHLQRIEHAIIQGNKIAHSSLAAPINIGANTEDIVIGPNDFTANPDISTNVNCKQVTFTQHKFVQYTFYATNVSQSDSTEPDLAGCSGINLIKLDKPAHLIGIYAKSNAAITAGSISITANGKTLNPQLTTGAQEANAWQQPFVDQWAADDSIQGRLVASADLEPDGSLDVMITLILAIDEAEQ